MKPLKRVFSAKPLTSLDFAASARHQIRAEGVYDASAAEVFSAVSDPHSHTGWFPEVLHGSWLSGAPHGVGSRREMVLKFIAVRERIEAWVPGKHFALSLTEATLPLVRRQLEDFRIEQISPTQTRLVLTVYSEPSLVVGWLEFLFRPVFLKMYQDAARDLGTYLQKRAGSVH